jgi:DNA-binding HxlR family transcriptional regulator
MASGRTVHGMSTYGQFCPVAMASEVLTERWTPLVIRELLCGSTRFNDLRRGVPLMSPSLLSKRLKTLERVGVIERRPAPAGQAVEYVLTEAGEELRPIIESMGIWGQRWARADVGARQMDASLLMWDIHRNIVVELLPPERIVVFFHLRGSIDKKSRFWLVLQHGAADVCLADPGYDVDITVEGDLRTMVDYWMGRIEFADAVRAGDLTVAGPRRLVRALPTWFGRSLFAPVALPEAAGV